MAIVRWEPFRGLVIHRGHFSELFDGAFWKAFDEANLSHRTWSPAVDVYETDQSVVLKAELAGVDPKDVEVRVEDGTLYLRGQRKSEKEVKEGNYHRIERAYGSFMRSFKLPDAVDPAKVSAEYRDGLLTLTLPKREEAKPKTIRIDVSNN